MTLVLATVYDALFDIVSTAAVAAAASASPPSRLNASRRLRHWTNVTPGEMPLLMMSQKTIEAEVPLRGAKPLWTCHADFMLYVHNSNPRSSPAMLLVPLIDAIRAALVPLPPPPAGNGMNDLGLPEMIAHAAIEGTIETDEGLLGDLAFALVPIKILCKPSY